MVSSFSPSRTKPHLCVALHRRAVISMSASYGHLRQNTTEIIAGRQLQKEASRWRILEASQQYKPNHNQSASAHETVMATWVLPVPSVPASRASLAVSNEGAQQYQMRLVRWARSCYISYTGLIRCNNHVSALFLHYSS